MPSRRTPPSPLPVEPYFRGIRGSRGFLHAIAEDPDDLALRLIFADWLDEQGHSRRANFIRLQCRSAPLPGGHPERERMEEEAEALWSGHCEEWLEGLPAVEGVIWNDGENFAGGLLEGVALDAKRFRVEDLTALFAVADWRRLRTRIATADFNFIGTLLQAPEIANLTFLDLSSNSLGDEGAAALAASPYLAQHTSLGLSENSIGDEGAAALAASPHLAQLTRLNLCENSIGDEGALALAASPHLAQLTNLYLWDNSIGDEGAALLRERYGYIVSL